MMLVFAGLALSFAGSLPPGLISLSVAHTAFQRTRRAALWVAFGAAVAEFFQACGAVIFAEWLLQNTQLETYFHGAAAIIFLALGIFLLFSAPSVPKKSDAVSSPSWGYQFGRGALISIFNLLAIPYWLVYYAWLRTKGWWPASGGYQPMLLFATGVMAGTFLALAAYTFAARWWLGHSKAAARYANRGIGLLFFGLGIWELYTLLINS